MQRTPTPINHDALRQSRRWLQKIMTEPEQSALHARVSDLDLLIQQAAACTDPERLQRLRDSIAYAALSCAAVGAVVAVREYKHRADLRNGAQR